MAHRDACRRECEKSGLRTNTTNMTARAIPSKVGLRGIVNLGTPTGSLAGKILRIPFYNGSTIETIIVQWMDAPGIPANGGVVVAYPTPFPNTMLAITAIGGATLPGVPGINVLSIDRASFKVLNQSTTTPTQMGSIIAIGK